MSLATSPLTRISECTATVGAWQEAESFTWTFGWTASTRLPNICTIPHGLPHHMWQNNTFYCNINRTTGNGSTRNSPQGAHEFEEYVHSVLSQRIDRYSKRYLSAAPKATTHCSCQNGIIEGNHITLACPSIIR